MLRRSLTAKILVAVGVTVAIVIGIYTYFVIRVQSAWWHERTQAQSLITATVVREYIEGVMLSEKHEEVQGFLRKLQQQQEILHARIVSTNGVVCFSTVTQEIHQAVVELPAELFVENRMIHGLRQHDGHDVVVVMAPVPNRAACAKCHDPALPYNGAIMLEKSLASAEASVASNRNLLIAYGLAIFVLVGFVLWLLIDRLVRQPVSSVLEQMQRVDHGDLTARADARRVDEIGALERGFNVMVQGLATARHELHESHAKQIQQAGKLASIGELASGIAHEIRNPLAGIGAAVEVLSETGNSNGQFREIVTEIHQQIHRLNRTLRGLLDFARQGELEITRCEVRDLLKPMLGLVRIDAQKQHIQVVEHYAPDLPAIAVDAQQMQQALLNILLNAVQAMPQGGTLTVSADATATTVRIRIDDTGAGIPSELQEKIFSPFFTTKHQGTGLGLAITRSIVEKHSGVLVVQSAPGQGTTFTLEFAASPEPDMDEPREAMSHVAN